MKSSKGLLGEVEWWGRRRREMGVTRGRGKMSVKEGRRSKQLWHLKQHVWNWRHFAN